MKTFFLAIVFLFGTLRGAAQSQGTPISPLIMGQGYHLTNYSMVAVPPYTAYVFGSAPATQTQVWNAINQSGCKLMRVGGKQYNIGDSKPLAGQEVYYVSIVDDLRRNGCEPVLTLPFLLATQNSGTPEPNVGDPSGDYDTAVARSIRMARTILHLVNTVHKRNVKYVILGNEPDKDYKWTTDSDLCPTVTSATQIAANIAGYIKPMSDAVRQMSAEIGTVKIIGPEYTHCLPEVYDELFTPGKSTYIGGISPVTNQPYLDFISIHAYGPEFKSNPEPASYTPSFSTGTVWTPSLTFCNLERYAKNWNEPIDVARRYRGAMHYMKRLAAGCTGRGNYPAMGWMVTEMNSGHTIEGTQGTTAAADAAGHGPISMQGAQNLARMYALAMEYGATSVMMWSVKESGNNDHQDRGYLVGEASNPADKGKKRPSWFHYKMLADFFSSQVRITGMKYLPVINLPETADPDKA